MKPGRELDAIIAEKVMGWTQCDPLAKWDRWEYGDPGDDWTVVSEEWCRGDGFPERGHYRSPIPRYSTSIGDAWTVVEKLDEGRYPFILTQDRYGGTYSGGIWLASFGVFMDEYERGPQGDDGDAVSYWASPGLICAGKTPAHAICLAALQVVNRENIE